MRGKAIAAVALAALVVLAIMVQLSYSQSTPSIPQSFYCALTNKTTDFSSCVAASIPLAMIGVLLSLTIVAVAYMLGNVLSIQGLRNWYQNELKEAAKSIIIVTVIFSVVAIVGSVAAIYFSSAATVSSSPQSITSSLSGLYTAVVGNDITGTGYLGSQIQRTTDLFDSLFGFYDGLGLAESLSISVYLPIDFYGLVFFGQGVEGTPVYTTTMVCTPPYTTAPCTSITTNAGQIVTTMLIALLLQRDVLLYIIEAGLGILIPVGVVLRALPFLRPLGGTFIGLGIGVALVYPSLLLFLNASVTNYMVPPPPTGQNLQCQSLALASTVGAPNQLFNDYISYAVCQATKSFGLVPMLSKAGAATYGFYAGISDSLLSMDSMYPILNFILSPQFIDILLQFLLFIFDIIIGITITNDIISALGGFKPQLGIGKIKLV